LELHAVTNTSYIRYNIYLYIHARRQDVATGHSLLFNNPPPIPIVEVLKRVFFFCCLWC